MSRTTRFGVVVLASTLALVGCAATPLPSSGPVAVYPAPDYGMDALLDGTVRLNDGCLVVEGGEGTTAVPVFPSDDVTWDEDSKLLTWRGETYSDGDAISLGGGFVGTSGIENGYFPEDCAGREAFLVSPY